MLNIAHLLHSNIIKEKSPKKENKKKTKKNLADATNDYLNRFYHQFKISFETSMHNAVLNINESCEYKQNISKDFHSQLKEIEIIGIDTSKIFYIF
jgi:hypothetical protein